MFIAVATQRYDVVPDRYFTHLKHCVHPSLSTEIVNSGSAEKNKEARKKRENSKITASLSIIGEPASNTRWGRSASNKGEEEPL